MPAQDETMHSPLAENCLSLEAMILPEDIDIAYTPNLNQSKQNQKNNIDWPKKPMIFPDHRKQAF